ncbi:MAG: DUF2330 domain-containing protein [Nitrospirae bacterium]|nr:MAG: DUF2330 domain-containing protein [Nitrospirota bacterium]
MMIAMSGKILILIISLMLQLLPVAETVWADGFYIPDRAYRKLPEIPTQRAILSYKDGIETLIIESALSAEGQSFGWIVPLPAEPIDIKQAPTELLNVFSTNTEPEIIHTDMKRPFFFVLLVTLFFVVHMFFSVRLFYLVVISILISVFAIPYSLGLGTRGAAGTSQNATRIEKVDVRKHVDVGSYEVSILKASRVDDLNEWLKNNAFAILPPKGVSIVEDYIKKKWVFAVARLKRQSGGLSIPHPLFVRFPVGRPVYPMRLTSLSGGDVFLRLFVVGHRTASLREGLTDRRGVRLKPEFADSYRLLDRNKVRSIYDVFSGKLFPGVLSHPDAKDILWPDCFVSSFAATVSPKNMTEDYVIELSDYAMYRQKFYSSQGAIAKVFPYLFIIWLAALSVSSLLITKKGKMFVFSRLMVPALCICIIGMWLACLYLPVVNSTTVSGDLPSHDRRFPYQIGVALDQYKKDTGHYPTTTQGLNALIENPSINGWSGPYLKDANLRDPWNKPYHYESPRRHVGRFYNSRYYKDYDLYSYGEDNAPGGLGPSADIHRRQ